MDLRDDDLSSPGLFERAVGVLVRRRELSTLAAGVTLADAADRLGVSLSDLAVLVMSTESNPRVALERRERGWTLRRPR